MNNSKLSMSQKVWLGLALIGVVVIGCLSLMLGKVWGERNQKQVELEQLRLKGMDVEDLELNRQILEVRLEELGEFFLEGETGVAGVAESLESIARETGVGLKLSFENFPKKVDIGGRYQQGLGMYAEVSGVYQGVLSWVRKVEQLPYFIRLSEVKMGLAKDESGVKAEFKGVIFLKNE